MLRFCRQLPPAVARSRSAFITMSAAPAATPPTGPASSGPPVQACLAVSRQGFLTVDASQSAPILEQPPAAGSSLRTLLLNKPTVLNALNKDMVETLHSRIGALDDAPNVDAVVLSAVPGRAFCAGGDIRSLYDSGVDGDPAPLADYFRSEYGMNHTLGTLRSSTLLSVLDGIVMGGGVGLTLHGRFRVATEKTVWAMPENLIGLFPDCAATYVLAKLQGGLGAYLALTGARLKGTDSLLLESGLATHYVPSRHIPGLCQRLGAINLASTGAISRAISEFVPAEPLPPFAHRSVIDACFGGVVEGSDGVEQIVERLQAVVDGSPGTEGAAFAADTLGLLAKCSPTSLKVTVEALRRAKRMTSLAQALRMDFRLGVRMSRRADFYAGVRSAIVTKDKSPTWSPSSLADVLDDDVQAMFEPLSADIGIPELDVGADADDGDGPAAAKM